jgi:cyanophycinase-like exopeptidase
VTGWKVWVLLALLTASGCSHRVQLAVPAAAAACSPRVFPGTGNFKRTLHALHGPGLLLQGGGTDIDEGFRWLHRTLTGNDAARGGNVIVLTAHTDDNAYSPYIAPLGPFQSVRTIGIPRCASRAQADALARYIDSADAVFFAGGDQAGYVPLKGGKLLAAVQRLWSRGGVIGGTSAGLAMQGSVDYDSVADDRWRPDKDVDSNDATKDPFEPELSFTTGFLNWPPLRNTVTDSHFARRDRLGRLMAFMARIEREHLANGPIAGLGIDERSELVVDKNGIATLFEYVGPGYKTKGAYLLTDLRIGMLEPGRPLVASVHVRHLARSGEQIDLVTRQFSGRMYTVRVDGGRSPYYRPYPYGV